MALKIPRSVIERISRGNTFQSAGAAARNCPSSISWRCKQQTEIRNEINVEHGTVLDHLFTSAQFSQTLDCPRLFVVAPILTKQ